MKIKNPALYKIFLSSNLPVFTGSKQIFSPMASFSCKNKKKVQGKGFEPHFNIKKVYVSPVDIKRVRPQ